MSPITNFKEIILSYYYWIHVEETVKYHVFLGVCH